MKDFAITVCLIAAAYWLLLHSEGPPIRIPVFSFQILAIPVFLVGAYLTFRGKQSLMGLVIMFAVAAYFMGDF